MIVELRVRRGTASEWDAANPILASGEPAYDTTNHRLKIGDGASTWTTLTYQAYDPDALAAAVAHVDAVYQLILAGNYGGGGGGTTTYPGIIPDASDPGFYLDQPVTTTSAFLEDTADPGVYIDDPVVTDDLAEDPNDPGFFITT